LSASRVNDNFNLRMLNLWIGLCEGKDPKLPKGISEMGYKVRWVEPSFQIRVTTVVQARPDETGPPTKPTASQKPASTDVGDDDEFVEEPLRGTDQEVIAAGSPVPSGPTKANTQPAELILIEKTINPEIIISSEEHKHAVVFEFKSGKNVEKSQLERYMFLKASDIAANILSGKPETHDVLYMAQGQNRIPSCMG
jgi:hypothetical protein